MCTSCIGVPVSSPRADLSSWIDRVRDGEELVVTERGTPVARLVAIQSAQLIELLTKAGVLGNPQTGSRPSGKDLDPVTASGSVSDLIREHRR